MSRNTCWWFGLQLTRCVCITKDPVFLKFIAVLFLLRSYHLEFPWIPEILEHYVHVYFLYISVTFSNTGNSLPFFRFVSLSTFYAFGMEVPKLEDRMALWQVLRKNEALSAISEGWEFILPINSAHNFCPLPFAEQSMRTWHTGDNLANNFSDLSSLGTLQPLGLPCLWLLWTKICRQCKPLLHTFRCGPVDWGQKIGFGSEQFAHFNFQRPDRRLVSTKEDGYLIPKPERAGHVWVLLLLHPSGVYASPRLLAGKQLLLSVGWVY